MTVYLLAHGSVDPRHAQDVAIIAERLAAALSEPVRACYLDLCPPTLASVTDTPGIVVPLLFSPGYHVKVDVGLAVAEAAAGLPGGADDLIVAEPPLLTGAAGWGCDLLSEAQQAWPGRDVVFVGAGTRDADVLRLWDVTAAALGIAVVQAGGPGDRLADLPQRGEAVALPLLAARGFFGDQIAEQATACGMPVAALAGTSESLITELGRVVSQARRGP